MLLIFCFWFLSLALGTLEGTLEGIFEGAFLNVDVIY